MASKREIIDEAARRLHYYDKGRAETRVAWDKMPEADRQYYRDAAALLLEFFAEKIPELGRIIDDCPIAVRRTGGES